MNLKLVQTIHGKNETIRIFKVGHSVRIYSMLYFSPGVDCKQSSLCDDEDKHN